MNADELELGKTQLLTLAPAAGAEFPSGLRLCREVRLWKDATSAALMLAQGDLVCAVSAFPAHATQLDDLCTVNLPRVAWVMDRKRLPDGERLRVQIHQFVKEFVLPVLDLAVDDKATEQARRLNPRVRDTDDVVAWLTEECFLPDDGAGAQTRAFLSMGERDATKPGEAFVLHGRSLRVFVRQVSRPNRDGAVEDRLMVDKVTRTRGDTSRVPIYLISGGVRFCDWSAAGQMRATAQAELAALASSDESFLRAWQEYGAMEERVVFERARSVGALAYDSITYLPDGIQFNLKSSELADQLALLEDNDSLEASANPPDLTRLTPSDPDKEPERRKDAQFVGKLVETPTPDARSLLLEHGDDQTPPEEGWLCVCVIGDSKIFERRKDAQKKIRTGTCAMPQLGLLLEGARVPLSRHVDHKALTDRVLNKVFRTRDGHRSPPTPAQEEAIRVALNTPDIALIQGPPGTGKTTVINAIIERLNEISDTSKGQSGRFLVTGFQHDAVENAITKLKINGLPSIKFGKRQGVDGYEQNEAKIDRWRQQTADQIQKKYAALPRTDTELKLKELLHSYVLAPGDLRETISLLDRVASLVQGLIAPSLQDDLEQLKNALRRLDRTAQQGDPRQVRLVRALRSLRYTPEAYGDDGPDTAGLVLALLQGSEMEKTDIALLQEAANWVGQGPPFLERLGELRRRHLLAHLPLPRSNAAPRVRQDVAGLLVTIRDALEGLFRRSRSGPDTATVEFLGQLEYNPEAVKRAIINYTPVYAATCQQAASYRMADAKKDGRLEYDSVLVDEAARATPLDLFIPMTQGRRRIILVGDHRQLPHIIDNQIERELERAADDAESAEQLTAKALKESLFERLFRQLQDRETHDNIPRTVTLDKQYRMHPRLGRFVSEQFYPKNEQFGSGFGPEKFQHRLDGYAGRCAAWVQVPLDRGKERAGQSKSRPVEADVIARELKRLIDLDEAQYLSFGVISFYSAQVQELGRRLHAIGLMTPLDRSGYRVADAYRDLHLHDGKREDRLLVGTVDAFQGREFDVVFLSMVRSNRERDATEKDRRGKYGHLMSSNRLCVSMSRQKCLLIVVGDADMLRAPHAETALRPLAEFYRLCQSDGVVHQIDRNKAVQLDREAVG